jgi:hypothetical protein
VTQPGLVDDELVTKALQAAIQAGVPRQTVDADLVELASGPQDEMTPIVLAGRLFWRARLARAAAARATGLSASGRSAPASA